MEPLSLEVYTGSGDISVRRGEDGILTVDASFEVQARTEEQARELAEWITDDPPIEIMGGRVRIGDLSKYDLGWGLLGPWVACDFRITAPARTAADLDSGSGDQHVQGMHGPVSADTGSGDVRIEDVERDVDIETGSGEITVLRAGGTLRADTGSGNVRVEDVERDVDIETGSGEITVLRVGGSLRSDTGSGDVQVEDVNGNLDIETGSGDMKIDSTINDSAKWAMSTGSGDVRLKLPTGACFNLRAATASGEFETDFPLVLSGRIGKRKIEGKVGESPRAAIQITTSSGDIEIKANPHGRLPTNES